MPYDCMPQGEMPFDRMPKYRQVEKTDALHRYDFQERCIKGQTRLIFVYGFQSFSQYKPVGCEILEGGKIPENIFKK